MTGICPQQGKSKLINTYIGLFIYDFYNSRYFV